MPPQPLVLSSPLHSTNSEVLPWRPPGGRCGVLATSPAVMRTGLQLRATLVHLAAWSHPSSLGPVPEALTEGVTLEVLNATRITSERSVTTTRAEANFLVCTPLPRHRRVESGPTSLLPNQSVV